MVEYDVNGLDQETEHIYSQKKLPYTRRTSMNYHNKMTTAQIRLWQGSRLGLALLATAVLTTACSTSRQMYSGARLPQSQVAIITIAASNNTFMAGADGNTFWGQSTKTLEVLPGPHMISVGYESVTHTPGGSTTIASMKKPAQVSFLADAGHVYEIHWYRACLVQGKPYSFVYLMYADERTTSTNFIDGGLPYVVPDFRLADAFLDQRMIFYVSDNTDGRIARSMNASADAALSSLINTLDAQEEFVLAHIRGGQITTNASKARAIPARTQVISTATITSTPQELALTDRIQKQNEQMNPQGIECGPEILEHPDGRRVVLDSASSATVTPTKSPKPATTSRAVSASPATQATRVVKDTAIPPAKQKAKNARLFTLPLSKDVQYVGNEFIFFGTLLNVEMNITAGGVKSIATYQCKTENGTTPNGFFLAFDETTANFSPAASNADGQKSLFRITGVISQTGRTIILTNVNVELANETQDH